MKKKRVKVNELSREINKDLGNINKNIIRTDFDSGVRRFNKDIDKIDKNINKEVQQVEKWVIERRKFFIKLGYVALLILVLFVISEIFLTVKVAG